MSFEDGAQSDEEEGEEEEMSLFGTIGSTEKNYRNRRDGALNR